MESKTSIRSGIAVENSDVAFFAAWGLAVWVVVTASMRVAGHLLLDPTNPAVMVGFSVAVIPLMALVTFPVYVYRGTPLTQRPSAAIIMSVPGLFLDVFLVAFFEAVFTNMPPTTAKYYGAILIFGYMVVLLTGFVPVFRTEGE